jgi:hypothetical protein
MSDESIKSPNGPSHAGGRALASNQAPFVYFDGVITHGVNHGVIQLELAARTVVPDGKGGATSEVVMTAHLRCSVDAAASLRQALDHALLLAKQRQKKAKVVGLSESVRRN